MNDSQSHVPPITLLAALLGAALLAPHTLAFSVMVSLGGLIVIAAAYVAVIRDGRTWLPRSSGWFYVVGALLLAVPHGCYTRQEWLAQREREQQQSQRDWTPPIKDVEPSKDGKTIRLVCELKPSEHCEDLNPCDLLVHVNLYEDVQAAWKVAGFTLEDKDTGEVSSAPADLSKENPTTAWLNQLKPSTHYVIEVYLERRDGQTLATEKTLDLIEEKKAEVKFQKDGFVTPPPQNP